MKPYEPRPGVTDPAVDAFSEGLDPARGTLDPDEARARDMLAHPENYDADQIVATLSRREVPLVSSLTRVSSPRFALVFAYAVGALILVGIAAGIATR